MARHIPLGYAALSIEHWLSNYTRPAVVTLGAKILGTETGGVNLADAFHEAFSEAFRARMDSGVTLRNARAVVGQDGADPLVFDSTLSTPGAGGRESTAPALALMLDKRTGIGGRRNRGRMYFPWAVADSEVSEQGAVASAALNNWSSACVTFMQEMTAVGSSVGTHLFDFPALLHSDVEAVPTEITSMVPNPVIRTQKQRQARF